jgi:hypothetical protein
MARGRRSGAALIAVLTALFVPSSALAHRGDQLPPVDTSHAERCDFLDQANCLFPWPNDHFTAAADTPTGRQLNLKTASMPANRFGVHIEASDYNWSDGFSAGQSIVTKVPGLDSQAALHATGAVPITDIGAYDQRHAPVVVLDADTGRRWPIFTEVDAQADDPADRTLIIRPAVNFDAGDRYIVALRNMREADGSVIPASAGFRYFRDGVPSNDPAIESRRAHFESIFKTLKQAGIHRHRLYLAWDFTVESDASSSRRMLSIRNRAFDELGDSDLSDLDVQGSAPGFQVTSVESFSRCGNDGCQAGEDDHLLRLVKGTVTVPCYLNMPGCPSGSRFDLGANGLPQRMPGNTIAANFECIVPHSAVRHGTAHELRPSLYGHGLLGSAQEVESSKLQEIADQGGDLICATDWIGLAGQDAATVLGVLQDLSRFPMLADRMQQGMLDFLFLGRAMIHPDGLGTDPAFQFGGHSLVDTHRLFYVGGSQGGIMGGSLTAVAPDFRRAYLGVPGMNYSTLLERSVDFDSYANGNFGGGDTDLGLYDNYPDQLERPLILSLIEMLWERGEANGYAHRMTTDPLPGTPSHRVLLQEAFGDHQVTNIATEVEARTIGAEVRLPLLDPGRSRDRVPMWGILRIADFPFHGPAAITQWDVGPLRMVDGEVKGTPPPPVRNVPNRRGVDPHGPDASETVEGQTQIGRFLQNGDVIDTCDGHPCYLDGYTGPGG